MNYNLLNTPIDYLKGLGVNRSDLIKKELKIFNYKDLVNLFPNRYIDKSKYYKIKDLPKFSCDVQIIGEISEINEIGIGRKKRLIAQFTDGEDEIELIWFKSLKWLKKSLLINTKYIVFGKLNFFARKISIPHPEIELFKADSLSKRVKIQPIYPSTENLIKKGVSNKVISNLMKSLLYDLKLNFKETIPDYLIKELKLLDKNTSIYNIHFPKNNELLEDSIRRLKFEELLYLQLQLLKKNINRKDKIKGYNFSVVGKHFNKFYNEVLSFELTNAQKKVLKEIRNDLGSNAQMNRLLQGDVGSGKTIIAFMSILIALDNGYQACLMAPTEILSVQHYEGFIEMSKLLNINIVILTGSTKASVKKEIYKSLNSGEIDIIVGTHSLIQDKVKFKNLGLAIIDEQHKFGVAQRSKLWAKSAIPPHILIMTATPIPRTLAMSAYGDLDISLIDELPPGRREITTVHRFDSNRLSVLKFIKEQINEGRQIYIVYPLIEESKNMDFKDLMDGYESLSREFTQPKYQISIVHGRMKAQDKEFEMKRFENKETQILIATTVIEVGVNIPNASVMIIESSERFGLSQLHQLRGRVGRGIHKSYCILMSGNKLSNESKLRLKTMTQTNNGFIIAEKDLEIRGPGDIMGTQQSGVIDLKIADLISDQKILIYARKFARQILEEDKNLSKEKNNKLLNTYNHLVKNKDLWSYIG
ncbi:MAG: ATP-dependent DNA helicase RecG [Flavobacteriales bacterium]|nr:ATP-dependent DNA helicase RecG [Flavobacteriaceae bacterium]RZP01015.1 MAG: ATP-dependent DNA helicase RecG [Flavobacteriales bacterium]